MTVHTARPEGMSEPRLVEPKPRDWSPVSLERRKEIRQWCDGNQDECADPSVSEIRALIYEIGLTHERLDELDEIQKPLCDFVPDLVDAAHEELSRLRADGATLPPAEWLRAFDELLRQHGIPDGLIVRDFTAWAARVMKGARVGLDEALAAHSASFGALQILSAALLDGEVDDYAALAEKIIARVTQAEADGATLRERVQLVVDDIERTWPDVRIHGPNTDRYGYGLREAARRISETLASAPKEPT